MLSKSFRKQVLKFRTAAGNLGQRAILAIALLVGLTAGFGAFMAIESDAPSYLGHGPEGCLNCHVMNPHYATWKNSSHSRNAECIDCHIPHDNIAVTLGYKGFVGTRDMSEYLGYREQEAIRLRAASPYVIEKNCRRCHETVIEAMPMSNAGVFQKEAASVRCWDCHRDVPHSSISSLSSTANTVTPSTARPHVAPWMEKDPTIKNNLSR